MAVPVHLSTTAALPPLLVAICVPASDTPLARPPAVLAAGGTNGGGGHGEEAAPNGSLAIVTELPRALEIMPVTRSDSQPSGLIRSGPGRTAAGAL